MSNMPVLSIILLLIVKIIQESKGENLDFPRCSAKVHCSVELTECFQLNGKQCCLCRPGFYGGGLEICSSSSFTNRWLRFSGLLSIQIENNTLPTNFSISHETMLMSRPPLGQTIIDNVTNEDDMNFVRLLTPIFHILNSFVALPASQNVSRQQRIYNIFSLASGFSHPFNFSFRLSITSVEIVDEISGDLLVEVEIKRDQSAEDFYDAIMTINVTALTPFPHRLPQKFKADRAWSGSTIEYQATKGKIEFLRMNLRMPIEHESKGYLDVKITGSGKSLDSDCLVGESDSFFSPDDIFIVKLNESGFCGDYCESDAKCKYYCADYPELISKNLWSRESDGTKPEWPPENMQQKEEEEVYEGEEEERWNVNNLFSYFS